MKRAEEVYREILFQSMENKKNSMTQMRIAKALKMSLSIVNFALNPLRRMNAIRARERGFDVIDKKKILYYWASIRNLEKDIAYFTRVEKPARTIESEMPSDVVYAAYSAYRFKFRDVPANYSEVYVYSDDLTGIEKRFPKNNKTPNLFVLKKDINLNKPTLALIFVDLWNLKEWYAKDFLNAMEERLDGILE